MISVNVSGGGGVVANVGGQSQPTIAVSPGGSLSGVSVSGGGDPVSVSAGGTVGLIVSASAVATTGPVTISVAQDAGVPAVSIGGGVGPAAVVSTTGEIVGVNPFSVTAGQNITVSQVSGTYVVSGVPDSYISSKAPVQLVQGRTGNVTIVAADITAGVFDVARIPVLPSQNQVISTGSLSSVSQPQQDFIAKGTVVTTADGRRWVYSGVGAKTTESSYVELADITPEWSVIANKPLVFAPEPHSHAPEDLTGGVVTSIQGRTGAIVLGRGDLTAAAAIHTHSTSDVAGLTAFVQALGTVFSVQGKAGNVVLSASDVTAAPATHTHSYVHSLSTLTGNVSVVGSGNVTVTTSASSITIYSAGGGLQWSQAPVSPVSDYGVAGDLARDASYIYVCNGSRDWKRAAISTWTPVDQHFSNVVLLLHFASSDFLDSSASAKTATNVGGVSSYQGSPALFGNSQNAFAIFDNTGATRVYLQYAYSNHWKLYDVPNGDFTIEFWMYGRPESDFFFFPDDKFRLIIGTSRWGIFITHQSVYDYGTSQRIEAVEFDSEGNITWRTDMGPIVVDQWNYFAITKNRVASGTQPGGAPSFQRDGNALFLPATDVGDLFRIGGTSVNRGFIGSIDEIRITKGISRPLTRIPAEPFPDA